MKRALSLLVSRPEPLTTAVHARGRREPGRPSRPESQSTRRMTEVPRSAGVVLSSALAPRPGRLAGRPSSMRRAASTWCAQRRGRRARWVFGDSRASAAGARCGALFPPAGPRVPRACTFHPTFEMETRAHVRAAPVAQRRLRRRRHRPGLRVGHGWFGADGPPWGGGNCVRERGSPATARRRWPSRGFAPGGPTADLRDGSSEAAWASQRPSSAPGAWRPMQKRGGAIAPRSGFAL